MAIAVHKRSVMTLFSGASDLYSHQVRIVLAEKGVTVDVELVDESNTPAELKESNPYKTVPTLIDRELTVYDSKIIMEYLDERFPHPPLMPVYPVARANARLMIYRIERNWYTLTSTILKANQSDAAKARETLKNDLLALAPIFAEYEFFMSEEFSLIDCYLAPLLWRLPQLEIELTEHNTQEIKKYMNRVFSRDSFINSLTDVEKEISLLP